MDYSSYIEKVPADLKEAISSVDISKKIVAIGEKNKLHIDQTGELGSEIRFVMMGKSSRLDFVKNVSKRLEIDGVTAEGIAQDVNEQIFLPIRESLQKIQVRHEREALDQVPGMETVRREIPQDTEDHSNLRKDDILADIENPVTKPVSPQTPQAQVAVQENAGLLDFDRHGLLEKIEDPSKRDVTERPVNLATDTDIVSMKLKGPVSAPVETQVRKAPTGYAVDPYREPLN